MYIRKVMDCLKTRLLLVVVAILCITTTMASEPLQQFTAGNLKFTARLYKELLNKEKGNFIFSPLSAEIVLALTQAGAKGNTAKEFTTALNLPESQETTLAAMRQLTPHLKTSTNETKLLSANKLFLNKGFKVLDTFNKVATETFNAGTENVDYNKPAEASNTINKWVEAQTNNKIQNLISPDSVSADTRLVLVNALYFSGQWSEPFEKYATRKEKFYTSDKDSVNVDMMHAENYFNYYECSKTNAKYLELRYFGDDISMVIVLPNERTGLTKLENEHLGRVFEPRNYTNVRVAVSMPKWKVESTVPMTSILQSLGLRQAFTDSADLSGISETPLKISDVIQKAFIAVDEDGTEAAAATAVSAVELTSFRPKPTPVLFEANHPFLYYLKYKNVILFTGKLTRA